MPRKLIIVSNRLPVQLKKSRAKWDITPSSGGLVSALDGVKEKLDFEWVGWAGADVPESHQSEVRERFVQKHHYHPIFLPAKQIDRFYNNFCNRVIWPLFHYSPDKVDFSLPYWDEYKRVNEQFCETVLPLCDDDSMVWVHDYHLFLLPQLLRAKKPNLRIGFFLHIPFPSSEIYRLLPVRAEILQGILGSDLIGFQTHDYTRHFSSACLRVLGLECSPTQTTVKGREVRFGSYPIGINPEAFVNALKDEKVVKKKESLLSTYEGKKVILGVDRADYIKGLIQKLQAFEQFLEKYPEWQEKVVLVQISIPSRTVVPEYRVLKQETDKWVGKINGKFGTPAWTPVHYIAKSIPFNDLCALYQVANVMLITSVRDGMNLVSLEYSACQKGGDGVLVMSEFAGAAHSLGDAVSCNPWDIGNVAQAIQEALTMENEEKIARARNNFNYVRDFNALAWARRFVRDLQLGSTSPSQKAEHLKSQFITLKRQFAQAKGRLLILDYDGTLVPFHKDPAKASPPEELLQLFQKLTKSEKTCMYLVSGRPQETLDEWFGKVDLGLSAEHGMFIKEPNQGSWKRLYDFSEEWMDVVQPILHDFVMRTPGTFIERKKTTLVWHYRNAEPRFAERQANELLIHLEETLTNLPVQVTLGNNVVEVRPYGVDKGAIVRRIVEDCKKANGFVLCMGDDRTDEDMFMALSDRAWSCRIGSKRTQASYYLEDYREVREILEELAEIA